jgi:hypothetical protein
MIPDIFPDDAAVRFALEVCRIPKNLAAAMMGVATSTVVNRANKEDWLVDDRYPRNCPYTNFDKVEKREDGSWGFVRTRGRALAGDPLAEPEQLSDEEMIENVRKSWRKILGDTVVLVAAGKLGMVQMRLLDRLDGAMRSFEKLVRLTGVERGEIYGAPPGGAKLSADELSDMLNKMAGRIDELAQEQYQNMVGGKLRHAKGDRSGA